MWQEEQYGGMPYANPAWSMPWGLPADDDVAKAAVAAATAAAMSVYYEAMAASLPSARFGANFGDDLSNINIHSKRHTLPPPQGAPPGLSGPPGLPGGPPGDFAKMRDPVKVPLTTNTRMSWPQVNSPQKKAGSASTVPESQRTTVMLRNLPNNYTRQMFLDMLDTEGFAGTYDFVYLPTDFTSLAGLGYAFVNLLTAEEAQRFWAHFDGFSRWTLQSNKVCALCWSVHSGLKEHIERYRNSPVMHTSVPDECKPVIFDPDGRRLEFPPPSKSIVPPRVRGRKSDALE